MLVLTRRKNEQIVIGENIVVTLVDVRRTHVRLGIEAPREVPVHRKEVYEALKTGRALEGGRRPAEDPVRSPSE
ncbi:MAG TPA: carbon storage regulator CsrA [Thermoguttaceae bacterium]|nr:carbon storage regulator CsrA [Thermoguttaceae bacterium]